MLEVWRYIVLGSMHTFSVELDFVTCVRGTRRDRCLLPHNYFLSPGRKRHLSDNQSRSQLTVAQLTRQTRTRAELAICRLLPSRAQCTFSRDTESLELRVASVVSAQCTSAPCDALSQP